MLKKYTFILSNFVVNFRIKTLTNIHNFFIFFGVIMKSKIRIFNLIIVTIFLITTELFSQSFLEKLKNKVEEKVQEKIEQKPDEEPVATDNSKTKDNQKENPKPEVKSPELQSYSKYDFIPGENLLFFDDFSEDKIGDFPANWNTDGTGEVVTLNNYPGQWLKMLSAAYLPDLKFTFPKNFTVEFDLIMSAPNNRFCIALDLMQSVKDERINNLVPGKGGIDVGFNNTDLHVFNWNDGGYGDIDQRKEQKYLEDKESKKVRISIWVQDRRARVYIDNYKAADIQRVLNPELILDRIRFFLNSCDAEGVSNYITNLRIAEAGKDDRNKLMTEGKLVVYGINFDIASDKIKPESYPVIKQIADVLKANTNIKIQIVGHTDSDGQADKNLILSQKRALSVKNFLIQNFSIDSSRISTDGKGATVPLAPNDNPENKAKNRRVEFIKK